ncbi:MAG: lytic transglycosylase domain-containing protein [Hyphomicrobiales bacterium]|nr:MAG: lytic transglycosylase domain-containing protein [Hyphomicrobiales bacterium]
MLGRGREFDGGSSVRRVPIAIVAIAAALLLGACSSKQFPGLAHIAPKKAEQVASAEATVALPAPAASGSLDGLIAKYSAMYDVPESLVRRVIVRESGYNPKARNGPYYGLMQISYATAQSMGYRGPASGLLDADTNLRYAVKYLSGAYLVGNANADQAVRNYSRGYYYDAKAKGLLEEVGLR